MRNIQRGLLLLFGLLLVAVPARAQNTLHLQPTSKLWIDGTSNKSAFTVNATELRGHVTMDQDGAPAVTEVVVTVPTAKVVSGNSTIMDRLIADALKAEEHPEISYRLTGTEVTEAADGSFTLQTRGNLTLAGVTKPIDMAVQGEPTDDGQIRFTGSYELLMTDYGMQPPSAMFGSLRVADPVTVHFDVLAAPAAVN